MVRRATGGRAVRVPGVHAAVAAHLRGFAAKWGGEGTLRDLDSLADFNLAVTGETIWRAMFDPLYPSAMDPWMRDESYYVITGPDVVETYAP